MDKGYWLREGPQTRLTGVVRKHAEAAVAIEPPAGMTFSSEAMRKAYQTCIYVSRLPLSSKPKDEWFRRRSAEQMIAEGLIETCSEYAVVFRALMIASGVPVSYLETFHENYLLGRKFHTHSFARVFDTENDVIIDPSRRKKRLSEADIFPYIIVAEGLDCWDLGLQSYDDLHSFRLDHLDGLMRKYRGIKEEASGFQRGRIADD
jgi:hypothetical protein